MTATAVSLTRVSLKSRGLEKAVVATRVMTSAVLDDIGSLVLVAIVAPLATGEETLCAGGLVITAGKAVAFFIFVTIIGSWIFPGGPARWLNELPLIRALNLRGFLTFDEGQDATLGILLAALFVGLLAKYFGFHPAIGAYMAGLIVSEEHGDVTEPDEPAANPDKVELYSQTKHIIDDATLRWVGPVFFVDLGAKIIF